MPKYEGPHDWLNQYVRKKEAKGAIADLVNVIWCLCQEVDADSIQDLFQDDMVADGYFDDTDEEEGDE
jgi:hypothetical protein